MRIIINFQIDHTVDADTGCFDELKEELYAFDITPEHSKSDYYFETESISFNNPSNFYISTWILSSSKDVPKNEIHKILSGAIIVLTNLEYALNCDYNIVSKTLCKPKFALKVFEVLIDDKLYSLELFKDFNDYNSNLQKMFELA